MQFDGLTYNQLNRIMRIWGQFQNFYNKSCFKLMKLKDCLRFWDGCQWYHFVL